MSGFIDSRYRKITIIDAPALFALVDGRPDSAPG